MKCPQCETALRLERVVATDAKRDRPWALRRFQIIDLLAATALIALHLASFPAEASNRGSDWAVLLYLTPSAITCLVHVRLTLKITSAMVVHYFMSIAWTFLHAVGLNYAINAYNPHTRSSGGSVQISVYSNAWNDTYEMAGWGIALAAVYGAICYAAVTASINRELCQADRGIHNGG